MRVSKLNADISIWLILVFSPKRLSNAAISSLALSFVGVLVQMLIWPSFFAPSTRAWTAGGNAPEAVGAAAGGLVGWAAGVAEEHASSNDPVSASPRMPAVPRVSSQRRVVVGSPSVIRTSPK